MKFRGRASGKKNDNGGERQGSPYFAGLDTIARERFKQFPRIEISAGYRDCRYQQLPGTTPSTKKQKQAYKMKAYKSMEAYVCQCLGQQTRYQGAAAR